MPSLERPPAGPRGRVGAAAESAAASHLVAQGWVLLGRNLRFGRDELDLLARAPAPAGELVAVEVRARSGPAFGDALESVDARKVARLYRAVAALRRGGHPAVGPGPLRESVRVDLVTLRRSRGDWVVQAHLCGLEPPA